MPDLLKSHVLRNDIAEHLCRKMVAEISMDSIGEIASPQYRQLENTPPRIDARTIDFQWSEAEAGAYLIPDWNPVSTRMYRQNNIVEIFPAIENSNSDAKGLMTVETAQRYLKTVAERYKLELRKKLLNRNYTSSYVLDWILHKIVARAFTATMGDVFAVVFAKDRKKLSGLERICTTQKEANSIRNFKHDTAELKYNGVKAYKHRRGAKALSHFQYYMRARARYLAKLKHGGKRRWKKHERKETRDFFEYPRVKIPATKYGRPMLTKEKYKRKGTLAERVKQIFDQRKPRTWKFWAGGWDEWKQYYVDAIVDDLKDVAKDEIQNWTKKQMETYIIPIIEKKRGQFIDFIKFKGEGYYSGRQWISPDGSYSEKINLER